MEYQVVVEYDPSTRHYTATVAGIPSIVVDAKTERTAVRLAAEAIAMYHEERGARGRRMRAARPLKAKLVTVKV